MVTGITPGSLGLRDAQWQSFVQLATGSTAQRMVGELSIGSVDIQIGQVELKGQNNSYAIDVQLDNGSVIGSPMFMPVGGTYNSAAQTYTDGDAAVLQMDSTGALKVTGGASSVSAEFTSPSDFTATYTSSSTLTLSALPISVSDASQIVYVKQTLSGNTAATYVAGANGVSFGYSSGVITIYQFGSAITTLASGDVYEVGLNAQRKAFDASTNSLNNSVLNPQYMRYSDVESLIGSSTGIGSAFGDIGPEIDLQGYNQARIWATLDMGSPAAPLQIKVLGKHTQAGTEEYPLYDNVVTIQAPNTFYSGLGSRFFELDEDSDQLFCMDLDCKNITPYIQLQFSTTSGTSMSEIDALYITKGYQ